MDWADSASLQSLSLQPLPTFFSLSLTWLLTWLLPSLPQWLSLHLFHSLSSTPSLHPRGATNLYCLCYHSVSLLLFLSVCLPASLSLSLSLIISINRFSLSLTLSCSKAAAPHSGLRGYDKEAANTCSSTLMHTHTNWHFTYRYRTVWLLEAAFKKSDCFSTLNSSYLVPHNCWIICLSNKKKKRTKKTTTHSLADWHTIQTQIGKSKTLTPQAAGSQTSCRVLYWAM